jgi:hypothetical protein
MDNLFTSTNFLEVLRERGYGVTGTCRTNSGVLLELVELKKKDAKDVVLWGETHNLCVESNLVAQTSWKDNAFCLMMSTVFDGKEKV